MESTGQRNKIQCSQETAALITHGNKGHWLTKREGLIFAKGKGDMQTYWVRPVRNTSSSSSGGGTSSCGSSNGSDVDPQELLDRVSRIGGSESNHGTASQKRRSSNRHKNERTSNRDLAMANNMNYSYDTTDNGELSPKLRRLVDWISGMMIPLLKQIVAHRNAAKAALETNTGTGNHTNKKNAVIIEMIKTKTRSNSMDTRSRSNSLDRGVLSFENVTGEQVLDEVQEIITLPKFDPEVAKLQGPIEDIELPEIVVTQLRNLVEQLALLYHDDNPFHNFEHASHVTMSVTKLLSRIVAPDDVVYNDSSSPQDYDSKVHDHTYGITSDPLTQFAVVFSALIHDVDHPGLPNAVLVKEHDPMAIRYKDKSVAEQNSVDIAWKMLFDDDGEYANNYRELRHCIYETKEELTRFRQLIVNSVMATDIVDKDLGNLRKARWMKAFSLQQHNDSVVEKDKIYASNDDNTSSTENSSSHSVLDEDVVNRKATIVIEHLIQASDVAHTMQHWDVYCKWVS